jgi:hypothetical protein
VDDTVDLVAGDAHPQELAAGVHDLARDLAHLAQSFSLLRVEGLDCALAARARRALGLLLARGDAVLRVVGVHDSVLRDGGLLRDVGGAEVSGVVVVLELLGLRHRVLDALHQVAGVGDHFGGPGVELRVRGAALLLLLFVLLLLLLLLGCAALGAALLRLVVFVVVVVVAALQRHGGDGVSHVFARRRHRRLSFCAHHPAQGNRAQVTKTAREQGTAKRD